MKRTRASILADLRANPERHRHTFEDLRACCFYDGALDVDLMQKHEGLGKNGGQCDVIAGECSCGAHHEPEPSVVDVIGRIKP